MPVVRKGSYRIEEILPSSSFAKTGQDVPEGENSGEKKAGAAAQHGVHVHKDEVIEDVVNEKEHKNVHGDLHIIDWIGSFTDVGSAQPLGSRLASGSGGRRMSCRR